MKSRKQLGLRLVTCLIVLTSALGAQARQDDLYNWFDRDLIPYVAKQLAGHPRFQGETVRFVIFEDGNPAPITSALGLDLLDRLRDRTADIPGVTIGWQPSPADLSRGNRATGIDCSASQVDYYVGLELSNGGRGNLNIHLRALDIAERNWVAGFSKQWFGPLSHGQRRAHQESRSDPSFTGEREVPYSIEQTDILASHLAHDLGCLLLSEMSAEYSVAETSDSTAGLPLEDVVELVSNNLSSYRALQITPDDDRANAVIEGKAHRIDGGLFQYWVTVKPKDATGDVPSLGTSAYIMLPPQFVAAVIEPDTHKAIWRSETNLLSSVTVVGVDSGSQCRKTTIQDNRRVYDSPAREGDAQCYALQVIAEQDAVVFFVNQQPNHGLVRLADHNCAPRTHARIARKGERVRLTLPVDTVANVSWKLSEGWDPNPDTNTYVAIAVSDTTAARAVGRHLQQLPVRCTESMRLGLQDEPLHAWTSELTAIIENWQSQIDWESVRVRNVY